MHGVFVYFYDKGIHPAIKANYTRVFDRFDVCILNKINGEM